MEFLAKLFDITKLPSKFFAWVALLSGSYVFLPNTVLSALHLADFPPEYRSYAGVAFVAATSFLLINFVIWCASKVRRQISKRRFKRDVLASLSDLDRDEVAVLREFFIQGRHVIELPVDHPTVAGLMNKHVIVMASRTGYRNLAGNVFPVQLADAAKPLLSAELLSLPQQPTEEDVERIRNERPNYMREIAKAERLRGGMYW